MQFRNLRTSTRGRPTGKDVEARGEIVQAVKVTKQPTSALDAATRGFFSNTGLPNVSFRKVVRHGFGTGGRNVGEF